MYINSQGRTISLGDELGKGGAANVFRMANNKNVAVKIFRPEYLNKERSLGKRLEQLYKLSQAADLSIRYGQEARSVGSWPTDIVKDKRGVVVGFTMDTVHNGIDLTHVIFARDENSAFYKFRNKPYYDQWKDFFLYSPSTLKNRFILCYYLAFSFGRIYHLKDRTGQEIDLELCNFDVKPNNILVSLDEVQGQKHIIPYILDLDNLTLKNNTGILAPSHPQFTPEYMSPEAITLMKKGSTGNQHGPNHLVSKLDKHYDYYSIAVIFYQILLNTHPFEGVLGKTRFTDGTNRDFYIENRCFPWGKNGKFLQISSPYHYNFEKFTNELQQLFIRALDADIPSKRPSMGEWSNAFLNALRQQNLNFETLFQFP